jgi:hypothetical protein
VNSRDDASTVGPPVYLAMKSSCNLAQGMSCQGKGGGGSGGVRPYEVSGQGVEREPFGLTIVRCRHAI